MDDIKEMTGEAHYGSHKKFDEVVLHGDTGRFLIRDKNAEKDEETGKYPRKDLGKGMAREFDKETQKFNETGNEPLSVVFLKIRRVLAYYNPTGYMRTSEHNHKGDSVVLYGVNPREIGTASDLREKHSDLHTQQIIYCVFPDKPEEIFRLIVKGASLGSRVENKEVLKFYEYLQTFKEGEHFYEYETLLVPVGEEGPKGIYYAMTFKRGNKLPEEKQKQVIEKIKEVHQITQEQDASIRNQVPEEVVDDSVKYPTENINPEDIPF